MRSFVINLERAVERRIQFCEQAARCGWTVEVFPAIDWRDLEIRVTGQGHEVTHRHLREVSLTGVPLPEGTLTLRAGHYACALSHMALWRKMLAEGDEWIGIFEDDAIIRGGFVEALPEDADFVFLGDGARVLMPAGMTRHSRDYIDWCRNNPYAPLVPGSGTFAYIVSRRGAEKGLSLMQPMFRPIDLQIMACGHGTAEARHPLRLQRLPNLPECRIYAATVPCARHRDGGKSYVNEDERSPDPYPGSSPAGTKCRKVVIGLGTGRCGTQSFAMLMGQQPGVSSSSHERIHLPWLGADDPVWQKQAESLLGPAAGAVPDTIHCEVGLWYLPYVPHLLAAAVRLGIDLKCVVLERPEEEVVASFLRKVGPHRNHWQPHPGHFDPYDACFPQFPPDMTREEAIRWYCRTYRARCRGLAEASGDRFRFFETAWFSSADKTAAMLEWCGIPAPRLSGIPHVDASAPPPAPGVASVEMTHRERRRAFLNAVPPYPGFAVPRGIVICGGGEKYLPSAWVLVNELQVLGCRLPAQLWHLGEEELPPEWRARMQAAGVDCVDAQEVRKHHSARRLRGWEVKPYAMLHCPFREVMLLDADNHPVRDPSFLFDSSPYQETGSLFWPDLGRLGPERAIWRICEVEYRDEPEFESGQMVVNKERCWRELQLAMHLNECSDFYYQHLHGDKDTFHMAWRMLDTAYGMVPHPVARMRGGLVQSDLDGARLFQHRAGGTKWKPRDNDRNPGPQIVFKWNGQRWVRGRQ